MNIWKRLTSFFSQTITQYGTITAAYANGTYVVETPSGGKYVTNSTSDFNIGNTVFFTVSPNGCQIVSTAPTVSYAEMEI